MCKAAVLTNRLLHSVDIVTMKCSNEVEAENSDRTGSTILPSNQTPLH